MSKASPRAAAEYVAQYEALLETVPEIERKGAAMPYTSVNGHMFSLLTPQGILALRLPSPEREAFLKKHKTKLCEQYGVVMKEYVSVPAALLAKPRELSRYLKMSFDYVRSLKPKATTKKKVAGKKMQARTGGRASRGAH